MIHRRSIDLLASVKRPSFKVPLEDHRPARNWTRMSDSELLRIGQWLREQVDQGKDVRRVELGEARAEWRRHPGGGNLGNT